jgi:hypothetical protein
LGPFGHAEAIDTIGSSAAPLLAGFSFALIGLVLQSGARLRWPDLALTLLVLAALLLIEAVHFAYSARRYYIPPAEWLAWASLASEGRLADLETQVIAFHRHHNRWLIRTRYAYNLGVVTLMLAVTISLVPPGSISHLRLTAIAIASIGFVIELTWTLGGEVRKWATREPADGPIDLT